MDLIGPVQFQPNSPYPGFNLEYRTNAQSTTWTALTMNEDYTVSDEVHTWKIRLTEQGIKKTPYYTETDYAGAPLATARIHGRHGGQYLWTPGGLKAGDLYACPKVF